MPKKAAHLFPDAEKIPEFDAVDGGPGIRIGGIAGELDVNLCMNTACGNFGKSWKKAKRQNPYTLKKSLGGLIMGCSECGHGRKVYNNHAVGAMYLHVLKQHLPFEYCEDEKCKNHRVNFYERYGKEDGYTMVSMNPANSEYVARCNRCKIRLPVGVPWYRRRSSDEDNLQLFMMHVCNNGNPSNVMEIHDIGERKYYAMLRHLAAACNSLSGRHLMELQHSRYVEEKPTIRLYSDIMEITVHLGGDEKRVTKMSYLVTVTDYRNSFFVLAATPMFVLADTEKGPLSQRALDPEAGLLDCHQQHAHLLWGGTHIDAHVPDAEFPVVSLDGYFVRTGYGALAHFLVLRKMLSRFGKIIHYIDSEYVLRTGAVTAFSDLIRSGDCEVVAVKITQHLKMSVAKEKSSENKYRLIQEQAGKRERKQYEKDGSLGESVWKRLRRQALKAEVDEIEGRLDAALDSFTATKAEVRKKNRRLWAHANDKAYVCGHPLNLKKLKPIKASKSDENVDHSEKDGDNSANENDGVVYDPFSPWIRDPLAPFFESGRKFLWLTRPPSKKKATEKEKDYEVELYMHGRHQPVDTYMAALRQVSSVAERPHLIAITQHSAGYVSNARRGEPIINELALQRFYWNFMRRRRSTSKKETRYIPRAHNFGLFVPNALTVEGAGKYRHEVFQWAEEITEWLGTSTSS